jgi:hypothetical protein
VADTDRNEAPHLHSAPSGGTPLSETSPDDKTLTAQLRRTSELISAQRLPEAENELLTAQRSSPRDLRVLKLLALVRFKLGRLAESRQVYREAAEVAPEDPAVRLNLGLIALKLESFGEAAQELESAVHLQPDNRRAWSYLGYAYAKSSSPAQAATAFRRAGQHELAAEMERAMTPSSHSQEIAIIEGISEPSAEVPSPYRLKPSGTVTPRPVPRSEATPLPTNKPKSHGVVLEEVATLASFTSARLLALPPVSMPLSPMGQGMLCFSAGAETHVRESALLVALGGNGLSLARRRTRGHLSGDKLASETDRFFCIEGSGELLLSSPNRKRGLIALALDHDVFYVEEERVVAWGDEVVWESGAVPGSGKALLQFRGTGRVVVLAGENELVTMRIMEGDRMAVPTGRLAGWIGRVVVLGQPPGPGENALPGLHHVACEGEGVLLLSRYGEHS